MLYLDPLAVYRIVSANRTGTLSFTTYLNSEPTNPNNVFTLGYVANKPTPTMAPLLSPSSPEALGQLWIFRPVDDKDGYWTVHCVVNSTDTISCLDTCLERTGTSVKLTPTASGKQEQMWFIVSSNSGDGKWYIQDREDAKVVLMGAPLPKKLDVEQDTNDIVVSTGTGHWGTKEAVRESTMWEIQYVRAANTKPSPEGNTDEIPW
jgi:hypothetical protein